MSHSTSVIEDGLQLAKDDHGSTSQIAKFYNGRCVLVTGASGFLGKLITEKLLRTCTGVKKIFLLIRPKRNKSASERLAELLDSTIFDRLKSKHNHEDSFERLKSKLVLLNGSLEKPLLGLNIERLLQVADEVSVIIHSAAVVSFVGKFRSSIEPNLIGTHNLLQLACKLPKLCALIHVSTSYSNCTRDATKEHLYPVNIEPIDLIEMTKILDDDALERLRAKLIGRHPNNYTYTKQLAEYLCGQFAIGAHRLPVLICRPSIIVSTHDEPIKGFLDNRNAGNGLFDGVSRGFMRTVHGSEKVIMDLVPADFVANCVLATAWFANLYHRVRYQVEWPANEFADSKTAINDARLKQKMLEYYHERKVSVLRLTKEEGLEESLALIPVMHITSGVENPTTFYEMMNLVARHTYEYPSMELFREPQTRMIENHRLLKFVSGLDSLIIGKLMDWFCMPPQAQLLPGTNLRRATTWQEQFRRTNNLANVLAYFILKNLRFDPTARVKLIDNFMNDTDRRQFNCDVRCLEWNSFARQTTLGIRRHLIGEPDETLPEAREKFARTRLRNSLLLMVFIAITAFLLQRLLFLTKL